jgi:hypothetical protein
VVEFARRNNLQLVLVADRLAFDERLWRKASPQMLKALYSCESEIAAWLDGSAGDDEAHPSPDANRRQNDAKDDGSQKSARLVLEI